MTSTARVPLELIADALDRARREKPMSGNPLLSEWVNIVDRHFKESGWKLVREEPTK